MHKNVITVENLSKMYKIGHDKRYQYDTFRERLNHFGKGILQRVTKPLSHNKVKVVHEDFWALKNISFEIKQGERVGIIGRNGAGKSTLLKILSRITEPTHGRFSTLGRVTSLLEVGTGFHPELTGRENIFFNGAILGMSRLEIKSKLDEIVAFAEIDKFLDTPVKRYSSGMYVRLAFSVAAHLESDILLIDEVLAVGDAQFQEKCLGKMKQGAHEGKTILFVSHNLALIRSLCPTSLLLDNSKLQLHTTSESVIDTYLNTYHPKESYISWQDEPTAQNEIINLLEAYITDSSLKIKSAVECNNSFNITIKYQLFKPITSLRIGFMIQNQEGVVICGSNDLADWSEPYRDIGIYESVCKFPGKVLSQGLYYLCFGASKFPYDKPLIRTSYCLSFKVIDTNREGKSNEKLPGIIKPDVFWTINYQNNPK